MFAACGPRWPSSTENSTLFGEHVYRDEMLNFALNAIILFYFIKTKAPNDERFILLIIK